MSSVVASCGSPVGGGTGSANSWGEDSHSPNGKLSGSSVCSVEMVESTAK